VKTLPLSSLCSLLEHRLLWDELPLAINISELNIQLARIDSPYQRVDHRRQFSCASNLDSTLILADMDGLRAEPELIES
jgi:hypothetical protein